MLATRSPLPKVTISSKCAGQHGSINLRAFLENLAKDSDRLTYRSYHEAKNTESPSKPVEQLKALKLKDGGPFLPLLPLIVPTAQQETSDDHLPETTKAAELQLSESASRRRSRSPRVTKTYTKKAKSSPGGHNADPSLEPLQHTLPELLGEPADAEDQAFEEPAPASRERDERTKKVVSRKRKERQEPLAEEDVPSTGIRRPLRKIKPPRRLPVSELALVRSIPSPTASEDESEVNHY